MAWGFPRSREWSPARLERRPSHCCRLVSGCWIRGWEPLSDSMEREEKTGEFLTASGRICGLATLTFRATTAALRATLCVTKNHTPWSGSGSCGRAVDGAGMFRHAPWSPFWSICLKAQVGNGVTTDPIAQPPRSFPSSLGRTPCESVVECSDLPRNSIFTPRDIGCPADTKKSGANTKKSISRRSRVKRTSRGVLGEIVFPQSPLTPTTPCP